MTEPDTPFEPPEARYLHRFLPGPNEWLPGHPERYNIVTESREYSCRITLDDRQRYMVCTRTPDRLEEDTIEQLKNAFDAVKASFDAYKRALGGKYPPLVWEIVGPLVDALMDLQAYSEPEAVVVGRDTHTGKLFVHPMPEFMSYLLWLAIQRTGRISPETLRLVMGFDHHYTYAEALVPNVRYRVHGDVVLTVYRYYDLWPEAVSHLSTLMIADETARRLPHALAATARELEKELVAKLPPLERGSTRTSTLHVKFRCPLDEKIMVAVGVNIAGLGLRYSQITRYHAEARPEALGSTYSVLGACDPLRDSCGSASNVANRLATLLYSEAFGGANAVFPGQMTIVLPAGDSPSIVTGPALLQIAFKAAHAASLVTIAEQSLKPVDIEVKVGNHRVITRGIPLRTWLLEAYSKLYRIAEIAYGTADSDINIINATARIISLLTTGDVTLLTTKELLFEHEEHGSERINTGPALVNISTLLHPTI